MFFNWQETRKKARQTVNRVFSGPGILLVGGEPSNIKKVMVRLLKKTEWAGEKGVQYQVENTIAEVDLTYVDNLYRNDVIEIQESNEVYRVTSTLPKKDGFAYAVVVDESEEQ